MSEPRISLAEIRATSERATWVAPWQVLALVAAVEAAQALMAELALLPIPGDYLGEYADMKAALAPFTDETTDDLSAPSARPPLAPPKSTPQPGS